MNPKKVRIYPYKTGSKSIRELKNTLGCKTIKLKRSKYRGNLKSHTVINWGNSEVPDYRCRVLNRNTKIASNKIDLFNLLKNEEDINIPPYFTNKDDLLAYILANNPNNIYVRKKTRGHGGDGIKVLECKGIKDINDIPNAPLYTVDIGTKHRNRMREFRVHHINCDPIETLVVKKATKEGEWDRADHKIKSHKNGWVFASLTDEEINNHYDLLQSLAIKVQQVTKLDFFAMDVVYNDIKESYYVLEINTAPGLEGRTIEFYNNGLRKLIA